MNVKQQSRTIQTAIKKTESGIANLTEAKRLLSSLPQPDPTPPRATRPRTTATATGS